MKILYIQNIKGLLGPAIVDNNVLPFFKCKVKTLRAKNKALKTLELVVKILCVDCIIMSSLSKFNILAIKLAKLLRKKTIYYMHGSAEMESAMANKPNLQEDIECFTVAHSDKIISVSETFREYVLLHFAVEDEKIVTVFNGIEFFEQEPQEKIPHSIITTGGMVPRKRNLQLCEAVQLLSNKYPDIQLSIVHNTSCTIPPDEAMKFPCVKYLNTMPHNELIKLLGQTQLYCQNSAYETFGLAIAEALYAGCDLVLAKNIGINDLLNIDPYYIIQDCENVEEIAKRIEAAFNKPNNKDILKSLEKIDVSWQECAKNIENVAYELVSKCKKEQK